MATRGVGVIGAGPGASALHLPTLAALADRFEIVHVADGGSGRAAQVAASVGARFSSGVDGLLADPRVDVVVASGPPASHAEHVLAAIDAGKRAVLCEKPLATTQTDAELVVARARDAGTVLVVGTNHLFDRAWVRAEHHLGLVGGEVRSASVTLALPPNDRYHALVTDAPLGAGTPRSAPDLTNPAVAAAVVRQLVLGLVVHDLPLLRDLDGARPELVHARALAPIGVMLGWRAGDVLLHGAAVILPEGADALWRLSISTARDRIDVSFPPAFVHAGSATVEVRGADGHRTVYPRDATDSYLAEWEAFAEMIGGRAPVEYDEILADARYAIELADAAAAAIGGAS